MRQWLRWLSLVLISNLAYGQEVSTAILGRWALVSQTYTGEGSLESVTWNLDTNEPKDTFQFLPTHQFKQNSWSDSLIFSLKDSLVLIGVVGSSSTSIFTYQIGEVTPEVLRLHWLDTTFPQTRRSEKNVIEYQLVFRRLADESNPPVPGGDTPKQVIKEEMPVFPKGTPALMKFIRREIRYPTAARRERIQGHVWVSFIISPQGEATEGRVIHSPRLDMAAEVVRVVKQMPRWTPGMQNGRPVPVKFILPVSFQI